jgi:hypothetical protein
LAAVLRGEGKRWGEGNRWGGRATDGIGTNDGDDDDDGGDGDGGDDDDDDDDDDDTGRTPPLQQGLQLCTLRLASNQVPLPLVLLLLLLERFQPGTSPSCTRTAPRCRPAVRAALY